MSQRIHRPFNLFVYPLKTQRALNICKHKKLPTRCSRTTSHKNNYVQREYFGVQIHFCCFLKQHIFVIVKLRKYFEIVNPFLLGTFCLKNKILEINMRHLSLYSLIIIHLSFLSPIILKEEYFNNHCQTLFFINLT